MWQLFKRDDRASVAVMFAMVMPIILLGAAISVDVETFYLQKRALQGATDLAALAAVQNPTQGLKAAQQNLMLNGFVASTVQSVTFGNYASDWTLPPAQRFVASATGTAVQVVSQTQSPYYFATILNMMSPSGRASNTSATINARATAVMTPQAAFAIGSGLASLNGGVLNAMLGGMLGSNVSLSVMDYQALAGANIDLFAFSKALATRAGLTALTYDQLANTQLSAPTVLGALADAANQSPGVAAYTANQILTLAGIAPSANIALGQLLSFGQFGSLGINSPSPMTATADALDMITAIAQIANGTHQVPVNLTAGLAPIASATLAFAVGEHPIGSSAFAIGPTGTSVHTAQTRLLLTVQIAQIGSTSLLNVPIYIELASATATVTAMTCPTSPAGSTATLSVTPAVVNAWIGSVSAANMTNFSTEPNPSAVTLVNLAGLGAVSIRANAAITNNSPTTVNFSSTDISGAVRKTTSTTDFTSSLLSALFGNLQMSTTVLGVTVPLPSSLSAPISATLATATAPIDALLSQVLQGLGVSLGNAYTWVSGVNCSTPKLAM